MQKCLTSVMLKGVYQGTLRILSKCDERKHARHEKTSRDKFSKQSLIVIFFKNNNLKQKGYLPASKKRLQLKKSFRSAVIIQLTWYGAVRFCACFYVKQKCELLVSYKARSSMVSNFTKSHVPNWFTADGDKQKSFCESKFLSTQDFVLSTYHVLDFADFISGRCRN